MRASKVICGVNEFECQIDGRCIHESLRLLLSQLLSCTNPTIYLDQYNTDILVLLLTDVMASMIVSIFPTNSTVVTDRFHFGLQTTNMHFKENRTCRLSQFRCGTGLCVDRTLLCNGESDCPDRADELECCKSDDGAISRC